MSTPQRAALTIMLNDAQTALGMDYAIIEIGALQDPQAMQDGNTIPAVVIMPAEQVTYDVNRLQKGSFQVVVYEAYDDDLDEFANCSAIEETTYNLAQQLSNLSINDTEGYLVSPTFTYNGVQLDFESFESSGTRLRMGMLEVAWGLSS